MGQNNADSVPEEVVPCSRLGLITFTLYNTCILQVDLVEMRIRCTYGGHDTPTTKQNLCGYLMAAPDQILDVPK